MFCGHLFKLVDVRYSLRADILFSEDVSYPVFNAMKMTIRD